jgi:membrane-bound lytic murein transglycosylase B
MRRLLAATVVALLALQTPAGADPTTSSTTPSTTSTTSTTNPAAPSTTTTTVRAVPLQTADNAYLASIGQRVRAADATLLGAQRAQTVATDRATRAADALTRAESALAAVAANEQAVVQQVELTRNRLRSLAVSSYVAGGPASSLEALLNVQSLSDFSQRQELVTAMADTAGRALHKYLGARDKASAATRKAITLVDAATTDKAQADAAARDAAAIVVQRTNQLSDLAQLLQLATAAVAYPGTDIPRLILDAYRRAAAAVQATGCQLPWSALAAIGKIESDHGRSHGGALTINGDLVPPIIGPTLDGTNGTALVRDTDHGRWDGDPVYDHAVGPMQIIPSTWAVIGRDGNGDGVADPNNIYDATLSAGWYLCRAAPAISATNDQALSQALFSYNHADFYVTEALALTHLYGAVALSP